VFYPSRKQIEDAFKKHFRLVGWHGIGIAVPPSYVSGMSPSTLAFLGAVDRTFSGINAFAGLADHRLAIFVRTT
jgi:hypothetical protein